MRIPSDRHVLGDVVVSPREVEVEPWQAHVLKHPFGLGALYNQSGAKGRRWDSEGWDAVEPPVLGEPERDALVALIQELDVEGARCKAQWLERRDDRGVPPYAKIPCYECPKRLAKPCERVTAEVGARYAGWVDRLLDLLSGGEVVPRARATKSIFAGVRGGSELPAAVLSTGWLPKDGRKGGRINTPEGIRVDFYLSGRRLQWRTTYRNPAASLNDRISWLTHVLPPGPRIPLSESVVVPRQWWQRNAHV